MTRCLLPIIGSLWLGCTPASQALEPVGPATAGSVPICLRGKTVPVRDSDADRQLAGGAYLGPCAVYGDRGSLGRGAVQTYVQMLDGVPWAIGVELTEATLTKLPSLDDHDQMIHGQPMGDGNNCFDVDGNGEISAAHDPFECTGGFQRILWFPPEVDKTPFRWMLLNWNPMGHPPMHVFDSAHFDFHFYIQDNTERNFIGPGPCGFLVDCAIFKSEMDPKNQIAPEYVHPDFKNVGAVEMRMGTHLPDSAGPHFQDKSVANSGWGAFSQTWVYGVYKRKVIFWEPMITLAFIRRKASECFPIKLPQKYAVAGYYPTTYCVRYRPGRSELTVSLEGFENRPAS
jgi:hypothetical protein